MGFKMCSSPLYSDFSLSFPPSLLLSVLPFSLPGHFFKYTSKIPQVLVSDNICHSYLRSDLLFLR